MTQNKLTQSLHLLPGGSYHSRLNTHQGNIVLSPSHEEVKETFLFSLEENLFVRVLCKAWRPYKSAGVSYFPYSCNSTNPPILLFPLFDQRHFVYLSIFQTLRVRRSGNSVLLLFRLFYDGPYSTFPQRGHPEKTQRPRRREESPNLNGTTFVYSHPTWGFFPVGMHIPCFCPRRSQSFQWVHQIFRETEKGRRSSEERTVCG